MSDFLGTLPTADLQAIQSGDLSKVSTATLQAMQREQMKQEMHLDPTEGMSTMDKLRVGIGSGMTSGLRAVGLNGLAQAIGGEADRSDAQHLEAPLDDSTAFHVGQGVGVGTPAIAATLVPGANTYLGSALVGGVTGGAFTEGDAADRAKAAALGGIGGVAGKAAGDAIGAGAQWASNKLASDAAQSAAANAQKDAAATAARQAGFKLSPNEVNPSLTNELLTGLSGKIKTGQVASSKNQAVTDALARQAVGKNAGDELTAQVLQGIRDQAATTGYAPVKAAGTVIASPEYKAALDQIAATSQGAARSFPGLKNNGVDDVIGTLKQDFFDAGDAVDATKVLRQSADKAYRQGDPVLGKAYKQAASALEDELDSHMQSIGQPEALQAFRDARKLIAKTYSVQGALNDQTGQISAQKLAQQAAKGRPLSDGLGTIANAAQSFPKDMQALKQAPGAVSPLDWAAQLLTSAHDLHNPLKWPVLFARPAVRSVILSKPYQNMMLSPSYGPGALSGTVLPAIGNQAGRAMAPLGTAGSLGALSVMNGDRQPAEQN